MNENGQVIAVSLQLDRAGLVWRPEIGDEISERENLDNISILVDPNGLTPVELRQSYLWLPTVEQLVQQIEAIEAVIRHAGITNQFGYEAIVSYGVQEVQATAATLRIALGRALEEVILAPSLRLIH